MPARFYGIPPEQVIGTTIATKFEMNAVAHSELMREAKVSFFDDGPGKPVAIQQVIGRRPVLLSEIPMATCKCWNGPPRGEGPASWAWFITPTRHGSSPMTGRPRIGKLDKALDEAKAKDWTVADMQQDWRVVYPSAVASRAVPTDPKPRLDQSPMAGR